jgi:hypothetical protein
MANMSYCRFQNTALDLDACVKALDELEGDLSALSPDEQRAAKRLFELARELLNWEPV